jgi:hypothetical protein
MGKRGLLKLINQTHKKSNSPMKKILGIIGRFP